MSQNKFNSGNFDSAVKVRIMHGLKGLDKDGLSAWDITNPGELTYDEDFDLTTTANQQRLYDICNDVVNED